MTRFWLKNLVEKTMGARNRREKRKLTRRLAERTARLGVEQLEDRSVPASTITIVNTGIGSLDALFASNSGVITITDGAAGGTQPETLSRAALQGASSTTNINVSARSSITFNNLGAAPLALQTGLGNSVTFQTTGVTAAAIAFNNQTNTLQTNGGSINFSAGTSLIVGNLNAAGGGIGLTAGTNGAGNINAKDILTSGAGNVTFQATNAAGGQIDQAGSLIGQAVNVTARGNVRLDNATGSSVSVTSQTGNITSATGNPLQASAQLTLSAATGIGVNTLAAALQATNTTSGNIFITQAASPTQALTTAGSGIVNQAAGGFIQVFNNGSSLTVAAGAPITSSNGSIILGATDFTILNTINSGAAGTVLATSVAGGGFDLGTDNVFGKVSLTQAELNFVTAGALQIGANAPFGGSITISQPITAPASVNSTLFLINRGPISQTGTGNITATNLLILSSGPVNLATNANNVGTLAANIIDAGFGIDFNNGTNTLTVGTVSTTSGITTTNGDVTLTADDLNISKLINPGTGAVNLRPFTNSELINLGATGTAVGELRLSDAELGLIASGTTRIGSGSLANTGGITVSGAITRTPTAPNTTRSQTLSLITGNTATNPLVSSTTGAITQTAPISVANLSVFATGGIQLTNPGNSVDVIAGRSAGGASGQNFRYVTSSTNTVFVGTVDSVGGISTSGNTIAEVTTGGALRFNNGITASLIGLNAGGAVTQSSDTFAGFSFPTGTTGSLILLGAGPYTLDNTNNSLKFIAGNVANAVSYTNAGDLGVSSGNYSDGFSGNVAGITTSNSPVSVNTVNGTLAAFNGAPVNAGAGTVSLTAGSSGNDNALTISDTVTGNGGVTLTADNMAINASVNVGAGAAMLKPFEDGTSIELGGSDGSSKLGLTADEINKVTAGVIRIGNSTAGDLTITQQILPSGTSQLELVTGNRILDGSFGTDLIVTRLGLTAGAGIGVFGGSFTIIDTQVSNLEATTTSGGIDIANSGAIDLTIGGVTAALSGVRVTGSGDINISNNSANIRIDQNNEIVLGPGNVTINAIGGAADLITGGGNGVPSQPGAVASTGAGTTVSLSAGRDVLIGNQSTNPNGFGDVSGGGSILLSAARDIAINNNSRVEAHGAGVITGTAGRDIFLLTPTNGIGDRIQTEGGAITLTTGADGVFTMGDVASGATTISTTQVPANGFGNITINADHVAIGSNTTINAGTAIVTIQQVTGTEAIQLGTTTDAELDLSNAELGRITAGTLRIGNTANTGNISVTAAVSAPNIGTLSLRTGGSVTDTVPANTITVGGLAVQAATGIDLDTVTSNLAFNNSTSSTVRVTNTGTATVKSLDGVLQSSNAGSGNTTVSSTTGLTFSVNTLSKGTATYTAGEVSDLPNWANDLVVDPGVVVGVSNGNLVLQAGDDITLSAGSTVSASGSVTITAAFNDLDQHGAVSLGGTIVSGNGLAVSGYDDLLLGTTISAPGQTVTLTSTNGAILDNNDIFSPSFVPVLNVSANSLALFAKTGIGRTNAFVVPSATLETQVNNLEATTQTGSIFIDNNSLTTANPLNIGGVTNLIGGVRVAGSDGDISITNKGSINITTSGEIVKGLRAVTVTATGVGSDVVTGGGNTGSNGAVVSTGATVTVNAGRDVLIGNLGGSPSDRVGDVNGITAVVSAGRNVVVDAGSSLDATGSGPVTVTAGAAGGPGDISVLRNGAPPSSNARISTSGREMTLTTGVGGKLTLDSNPGSATLKTTGIGIDGDITITADKIDITASDSIDAGAAVLTIQQKSAARDIDMGSTTDAANALEISDAELGRVTAGVVRIGDLTNTGIFLVTAPITTHAGYDTLHLRSASVINEGAAGSIVVDKLALEADLGVLFDGANNVSTLAAKLTGATSTFRYRDNDSLAIGSVDGIDGVSNVGNIEVYARNGTLTVNNTPATNDVSSSGGSIGIVAPTFSNSANARINTGVGDIHVIADNVSLAAGSVINAGAGRAAITTFTGGTPIDLGGADTAAPVLGLTSAEINTITAGVIQIGDNSAGPITITAAIIPTGASVLDLESGSTITQTTGAVGVSKLAIRAADTVTLANAGNDVGQLAAFVYGAGAGFSYVDNNGFTVGTVDGLSGITTSDGVISVSTAANDLFITQNISAGAANISLAAVGTNSAITNSAAISNSGGNTIDLGANQMVLANGTITASGSPSRVIMHATSPGRLVNLGRSDDLPGSLNLSDAELDTVTADVLQIGNGTEGNVTIAAGDSISISPVNVPTLSISTNGNVNGGGTISAESLRISAATGVNLPGANDVDDFAAAASLPSQAVLFNDVDDLDVGTVDGVVGVTSFNGPITLSTTNGDLAVLDDVDAGTGSVVLTAGGLDRTLTNLASVTGGSATLTADRMDIGGVPNQSIAVGTGPTNVVTLKPFTAARPVNLDNTAGDPTGELRLSQTELNTIAAGLLRVGGAAAGDVTLKNPVLAPTPNNLSLVSGGAIGQNGSTANIITATNLSLQGAGGVDIQGANIVNVLSGSFGGANNFVFEDGRDLVVGNVDGVNGIVGSGTGDVSLIIDNPGIIAADPGLVTVSGPINNPNGDVSLKSNNVAIGAAITGDRVKVIQRDSTVTNITLGGADGPNTLALSDAEIDFITANILQIGDSAAAPITVTAAISVTNATTLDLESASAISDGASGALSANNLVLRTPANIVFDNSGNNVSSLAASVTGAGADLQFVDSAGGFTIAQIDGVNGLAVNDLIDLVPTGPVTQGVNGNITATNLRLRGTGSYTLNNAANDVTTIAASAGGAISYNDANALTIGSILGINGVATNNTPITITTTAGALTVSNNVAAGTAAVSLTAGGTNNLLDNNAAISGNAVTLKGDRIDLLGGTVNAGAGAATLAPSSDGRPVNFDNTAGDPSGELRLSQTELNTVTAATLRVGGSTAGNVTLKNAVTSPSASLSLISGGSIGQNGNTANTVAATNLSLQGAGGVDVQGLNLVSTLSGSVGGTNAFTFAQGQGLAIGTVDGVAGITGAGGAINVSLTAPGALTVGSAINNPNGSVVLTANNQAINAAINALGANGFVNLKPATAAVTSINLGGADSPTTLGLTDAELDQVKTNVLRIGGTTGSTPIVVSANLTGAGNYTTLSLKTAGAVTQSNMARVSGTNLSIEAGSLPGTASSRFLIGVNQVAVKVNTGSIFLATNVAGTVASTTALDGVTGLTAGPGGTVSLVSSLASANAYAMLDNAYLAYAYSYQAYLGNTGNINAYNAYLQALGGYQYAQLSLNALVQGNKALGVYYAQLAAIYLDAASKNALALYNQAPTSVNYYSYLYSLRGSIFAAYVAQGL